MPLLVMLCSLLAAVPDGNDPRQRVLNALVDELSRSQKDLRLRGHEAPYFLSLGPHTFYWFKLQRSGLD